MTTINESTSIVAVQTKQLTAGQTSIVYVSSTADIGQLVTVFDVEGFLSTPQSILVSSTQDCDLGPNISSAQIQQRFGYITLRSVTRTSWAIVNENAFRTPASDYSINGLQTSSIQTSNASFTSTTTVNLAVTRTISTTNASFFGPLFVSSLGTNTSTFIVNSLSNRSNYVVQSSIYVVQGASVLLGVSTVGPLNVQSNLSSVGGFTTASTMFLQSSLTTTQRILVGSNITVQGVVTVSSNLQCFTSASTFTTAISSLVTGSVSTNNVLFDSAQMHGGPHASLYVSSGLTTLNLIQTSTLNTQEISTTTMRILSTIYTPAISISTASFINTGGSLTISSIGANTAQYSTLLGHNGTSTVRSISTQASIFSTLSFLNELYATASIDFPIANINNLYSDRIDAEFITSGGASGINLDALSLSTIVVSSALLAGQMSSFVVPNAAIAASQIDTAAAIVRGPVNTPYLTLANGLSDTGVLRISTPVVSTANIQANLLSTAVGTTSTLSLSNAFVGPVLIAGADAPYFIPSTFSGFLSNTPSQYIRGSGAPWSPFHIVASDDSDTAAYISGGSRVAYLTMQYSYTTTALSTLGTASIVLKNPITQSTLVTFSSTTAQSVQKYTLSNYQIDTKVISSVNTYNLIGPVTYAPPSTLQSQQTLIAGGQAASVFQLAYSSDAGTTLTSLPYVGFETATYGLAFGSSKWVAVGDGTTNTMIFSYTGTVWYNLGKAVFSVKGLSVSWNGSIWVATGEGTNTIATSADGITWTGKGATVFSVRGFGAASDGTTWVAVGQGTNTLARSANNGTTWLGQGAAIFSVAAYGVAWNGSIWVAVGQGTNTIATSADGTTWVGQGSAVFSTAGRTVAWNGSYWLAGSDTNPLIARSSNGFVWTTVAAPFASVYTLVWTGTQWVAGGQGTNTVATSPDGITWTAVSTALFTAVHALATRAQSTYTPPPPLLIIGGQGSHLLATSSDAITWTPRTVPFTSSVRSVVWNGTLWVAGGSGTFVIATSTNGLTWTGISIANMTAVFSVAWGRGKWIAVGTGTGGHTRAESADGITWTPYTSSTGSFFTGAAYGIIWAQGIWLAAGTPNGSGLLFSLDGANWIPQMVSVFTTGRCVSSNGTLFLAGGTGVSTTLAYSLEGTIWGTVNSPFTTQVNGIAWGETLWVAVGQGVNTLAYSYNGITWIGLGTSIFSTVGNGIVWTGSGWIATGQGTNTLATSLDGITWVGQGSTTFTISGTAAGAELLQPNTTIKLEEPESIRWNTSGVAILSPTIIEKPARTNPGYDSYARSTDGFTADAFLQFRPFQTTGSFRIGLTETTTPLSTLSYAFSFADTGVFEVRIGGSLVVSPAAFSAADAFQISYDGARISFQRNSVELFSVVRSPGLPLFLETQFNLGGTRLYDLEFHPLNKISETISPLSNQFYTTAKPSGLLEPSLSFVRPIVETGFSPSLWEFAIPMSGTLVTPSSMLYADVWLSTNFLFSTATLQTALSPTPSTYRLSYTLSTPVTSVPGDQLKVNIFSQHSRGTASIYSTVLTTSVYNLSSVQYVELVHSTPTGTQTSDLSLWIRNVSTPTGSYVNSNAGIDMNLGFMRWNGRQYGITIQNPYNDLQTRTLTYTGALYTASDSTLKHDIGYADTASLYGAIQTLPLHRYSLLRPYREKFRVEDTHQLGVLTTEVAAKFPEMIKTVDSDFVPDLQTVDRVQLRYAHLGATQHIMGRLSTLKSKIEGWGSHGL
jgi:hypothetical protein